MFKDSDDYYKEVQALQILNKNELKDRLFSKLRKDTKQEEYEEKKKKIKANKIVQDLECPICFGAFLTTTVTICGHSFCEKCYADSIIHKPGCPICRVKVRTHQYHYCKTVDKITSDRIQMDGKQKELEEFEIKKQDYLKWIENKTPNDITVNEELDVMDSQFIWCVGKVIKITKKEVLIRYVGWGSECDEFIPKNQNRLAPKGFYTNRDDIPKYKSPEQPSVLISILQSHQSTITLN